MMTRSWFAALLCIVIGPSIAFAATFTVTTNADSGAGSMRQAILDANALAGVDNIHFNIGAGGLQIISLTSPLPTIADTVNIDGTTQPGFAGTPIITLDGNDAPGNGLILGGSGSTIRGLVIVDFANAGIAISSGGATIAGNYIGIDASGLVADGNGGAGIDVAGTSHGNIIGGTAAADRNVISANGIGITFNSFRFIEFSSASSRNVVQGNIIGLDATGSNALGNASIGVRIVHGDNNRIGGTAPGAGNVIAGNAFGGIVIFSNEPSLVGPADVATANVIEGNRIGTNGAGNVARPNGGNGVVLGGARGTTVGGTAAGAGNIISGNGGDGIVLSVASGFRGFPSAEETVIQGNFIGTDSTGTLDIGNGSDGIALLFGRNNTIGGTAAGEGNTIRFNNHDGIADQSGSHNQFLGNSIDRNDGRGISGAVAGPVLTSATGIGTTNVAGTFNRTPGRTFRIEFFNSPAADPSGFGEGATFLGFTNVTTDSSGNATIAASFPPVAAGTVITATATDLTTFDTSQFSNAIAMVVPTLNVGDVTLFEPDSGTASAVFTVTLTAPAPVDVTFNYATGDGTATAPGDYTPANGTGSIPAGSLSTTISVPVIGDPVAEPDETFFVNVTGIAGAVGGDTQGQATITNEDAAPIPTLSTWALLLMAIAFSIGGLLVIRR